MADAPKFPWFPMWVNDWLTNEKVLDLTDEQRGIYHWLLCRQWLSGGLPVELDRIHRLMPGASNPAAVAYVVEMFFPVTNGRRVNVKLASVYATQEAEYVAKIDRMRKAREAKSQSQPLSQGLSQGLSLPLSQALSQGNNQSQRQSQRQSQSTTVAVGDDRDSEVPAVVRKEGEPWFRDPQTRKAREGEVRMILGGARGPAPTPEVLARALADMHARGKPWSAFSIKTHIDGVKRLIADEQAAHGVEAYFATQTPKEPVSPFESEDDIA